MKSYTEVRSLPKNFEVTTKLKKFEFKAMGTTFSLACFPQPFLSEKDVEQIFQEAEREVLRIQSKCTEFFTSPFNLINDFAGMKSISVDDEIYFLLKKAQYYFKISQGRFQISTSSFLLPWKRALKAGEEISEAAKAKYLSLIDDNQILLDDLTKRVYLPEKEMRIGLGGLGKGYAVDRAFTLLKKKGFINFYVNGGGDTRYHSHHSAPRPWRVGIQNPFTSQQNINAGWIQIENGAISTSGSTIQQKSATDHHILNLKGQCQSEIISATIIGQNCMDADAFGTIFMTMSWDEAREFSQKNTLKVILIHSTGKVFRT